MWNAQFSFKWLFGFPKLLLTKPKHFLKLSAVCFWLKPQYNSCELNGDDKRLKLLLHRIHLSHIPYQVTGGSRPMTQAIQNSFKRVNISPEWQCDYFSGIGYLHTAGEWERERAVKLDAFIYVYFCLFFLFSVPFMLNSIQLLWQWRIKIGTIVCGELRFGVIVMHSHTKLPEPFSTHIFYPENAAIRRHENEMIFRSLQRQSSVSLDRL